MMPDSPAALQGALVPWQGIRAVPPFSHVPAHRQGEEASVAASQMPPFLIHLFLALIRRRASASLENRASAQCQRLPLLPTLAPASWRWCRCPVPSPDRQRTARPPYPSPCIRYSSIKESVLRCRIQRKG